MSKCSPDDVVTRFFNDDNEDKPSHRREHLVNVAITMMIGISETPFTHEQRKWMGSKNICINSKGKNRMSFAARDLGHQKVSSRVIKADGKFKGKCILPGGRPDAELILYPVKNENRTFIG